MLELYQTNILDEEKLLQFFKQLEETNIINLFLNQEILYLSTESPRIIACYEEIPKYRQHLRRGIVHKVFLNTKHPEDYTGYISELCKNYLESYSTKFSTTFVFTIWTVWEEREYINLYSSIQLWILGKDSDPPRLEPFQQSLFNEEQIRRQAAKDFFQKIDFGSKYLAKKVTFGKTVYLIDTLAPELEQQETRERKMKRFLQSIKLGKIGLEEKRNYFFKNENLSDIEDNVDEDTMEALNLAE
ncbi:hypothetical protein HPP92_025182 [Vanilla planifolia]|uniref:Uncharacterized protein n=1 Tax=Vanilla planifolia TaxID=51239 RepID=A0A835UA70_VANPL|nr:hypothetical protein HPP92_025182 [Vanilla planifolia]